MKLPFEQRILARSCGARVLERDVIGLETQRLVSIGLVSAARLAWRFRDVRRALTHAEARAARSARVACELEALTYSVTSRRATVRARVLRALPQSDVAVDER